MTQPHPFKPFKKTVLYEEVAKQIKQSIRNYDINRYMDAVRQQPSWLVRVDDKTIGDLWEVRRYLELGIAHLAAMRGLRLLSTTVGQDRSGELA